MADRGYDSMANHEHLHGKGILPVIHIQTKGATLPSHDGIYTEQGVPTCLGQIPMEYLSGATRRRATCTDCTGLSPGRDPAL